MMDNKSIGVVAVSFVNEIPIEVEYQPALLFWRKTICDTLRKIVNEIAAGYHFRAAPVKPNPPTMEEISKLADGLRKGFYYQRRFWSTLEWEPDSICGSSNLGRMIDDMIRGNVFRLARKSNIRVMPYEEIGAVLMAVHAGQELEQLVLSLWGPAFKLTEDLLMQRVMEGAVFRVKAAVAPRCIKVCDDGIFKCQCELESGHFGPHKFNNGACDTKTEPPKQTKKVWKQPVFAEDGWYKYVNPYSGYKCRITGAPSQVGFKHFLDKNGSVRNWLCSTAPEHVGDIKFVVIETK